MPAAGKPERKRTPRKPLPVIDAELVNEQGYRPVMGYLPPAQESADHGPTLDVLSETKRGLAVLESKDILLKAARLKCLRHTLENDWVAHRTTSGDVFLYLCGQGGERVAPFLKINGSMSFVRVPPLPENPAELTTAISAIGETAFAYQVEGDFECEFFGRSESFVGGRAFDPEDPQEFFGRQRGLKLDLNVKRAAKTNIVGAAVRKFGGFENLPVEELAAAWQGSNKSVEKIPKGHGWPRDRKPGQERPPGPAPSCPKCKSQMNFRPAGTNRQTGNNYDAFWGCSDRNCRGYRPVVWPTNSTPSPETSATAATPTTTPQPEPQSPEPQLSALAPAPAETASGGPQWRCKKATQSTIENLIRRLRERGISPDALETETKVADPALLDDAAAQKYVATLAQRLNALGKK